MSTGPSANAPTTSPATPGAVSPPATAPLAAAPVAAAAADPASSVAGAGAAIASLEDDVARLTEWFASPRFEGILRLYSPRQVAEQCGSIRSEYPVARDAAQGFHARLRTLFWHLADRWCRVTPDGVVLPLRLTHSLIAQLTGLRRPSVSISLGELERAGEIVRLSKGSWLIARDGSATAHAA